MLALAAVCSAHCPVLPAPPAAADKANALTGLPAERSASAEIRMQLAPSAGGSTLKLRISPSGTIEAVEGEACQLLNVTVA